MSSRTPHTPGNDGDGEENGTTPVSRVLAAEKDHSVSIERTSDGKNAHIVVDGETLCPNSLTTTDEIGDDLPPNGVCEMCKKRAKLTEVVSIDEIVALLPESTDIGGEKGGILRTDGGTDPFNEVCSECGRQVVKAGHAPDCSNAEDRDQQTDTTSTTESDADTPEPHPEAVTAIQNARSLLRDFEEIGVEERHGVIKHAIEELENAQRRLPDDY